MGWRYCGQDNEGRDIGYGISATCDQQGCDVKIDRGLGFVCGGMHGEDEWSCEKYFCEQHRRGFAGQKNEFGVCAECEKHSDMQLFWDWWTGEWEPDPTDFAMYA